MARRSARPKSNHTILLVDDQQDTLLSVGDLLGREGHHVLTAESGAQALEIIKTHDLHVIVVDYFMPRMTGAELVREIRAFDPYVQIILQTGYSGERPPRVMLAELDIQGYHDKADDPERLLLWVDVALKAYRMVHALHERERLQSELVANCSHEFRTPLNIILGYAELLRGGDFGALSAEAETHVGLIEQAAVGLSNMVADFLQYAKLDVGVPDGGTEPVGVSELLREMERLAALVLGDKPVTFAAVLDPTLTSLRTDGTKLRTILRNLVVNAAKFTPAGTITLRILRRRGQARIEVKDTGPGIRPEDQQAIFEPFRQLDGSSTREQGGVGLGLALSRKLARTLGGDLQIESEPEAGATFVLTLPAEEMVEEARGERPAGAQEAR
jgi:signal transduction histidine kinase